MEKIQREFFSDKVGAVLTDKDIVAAVAEGHLIAEEHFSTEALQPSSYDCRVGSKGIIGGEGVVVDIKERNLQIPPGAYAGVISLEKMVLPATVCARISSKRALSYDGIILLSGGIVDPGYEGHLLFGLYNASNKKVVIPYQKKICNIVFERLADKPERQGRSDPHLRRAVFPDSFVDKMANMDVLPWMQMSERVKQIEQITKDILDLKARYDDVLEPIKELTVNVRSLTDDVDRVNQLVAENGRQINQLSTNLTNVSHQVTGIGRKAEELDQKHGTLTDLSTRLKTNFDRFQYLVYAFWTLLVLIVGSFLPVVFEKLFR